MFKFIHTADWHLGKIFKNSSYSLFEIQQNILKELCNIVENNNVDAVIICGDIFDTYNPSFKAEELFYNTVIDLTRNGKTAVIIISGNHDAPDKFETVKSIISGKHPVILGSYPNSDLSNFSIITDKIEINAKGNLVNIKFGKNPISLNAFILPYPSEVRFGIAYKGETTKEQYNDYNHLLTNILSSFQYKKDSYNMIISHLFISGGICSGSESALSLGGSLLVNTSVFPETDYVALGHIHNRQVINDNIYYSGSIFPFNIDEVRKNQPKGIWLGEIDKELNNINFIDFESIPQIVELNCANFDEAIKRSEEMKNKIVYLKFSSSIFLTPLQLQNLSRAYNKNLLKIEYEIPQSILNGSHKTSPEDLTPVELFKLFYISTKGKQPSEELVQAYINMLEIKSE